jgi:hypothetical protein
MNKNLQYALLGIGSVVLILAFLKYQKETTEPKLDDEMEALIKRIDEAKK